jgi:hypothetical protein
MFSLKNKGEVIGMVSVPNDQRTLGNVMENKNIKNKILKPKTRSFMP